MKFPNDSLPRMVPVVKRHSYTVPKRCEYMLVLVFEEVSGTNSLWLSRIDDIYVHVCICVYMFVYVYVYFIYI